VLFALDAIKKGESASWRRQRATGFNNVSIRVNVTTDKFPKARQAAQAFAAAYAESVDWMYANVEKSAAYWANSPRSRPRSPRKASASPERAHGAAPISGLD
jgi:ABC-type nitrate/sulfonate/bicarbonate transport system substrate-binding protein